ncbi:DUF1592 domain-containing protein [Marinicellulosiphila megalodicopiae]|uniref:DUF1592 domain-containing protein n=1 Tax=Marinicellulosiphila megalodicopiae TaxID=2724896 RepID=UPI003BB16D33
MLVICSLCFFVFGCEPTEQRAGSWFGGESENQAPIIEFNAQSDGLTLNLKATATDAESDELSYLWKIEIGEEEPIQLEGSTVSFQFESVGEYSVELFVNDGHGYVNSSKVVLIQEPVPITGESLFNELCTTCHSADGQGSIALVFSKYPDRPSLSSYIQNFMPQGDAVKCDESCADLISQYLKEFNQLYSEVEDLLVAEQMFTNSEYGYCDTCHEGTEGRSIKIKLGSTELRPFNWNRFDTVEQLVQFVNNAMPYNDHEACTEKDNCALLAGTYMWSQKEVVETIVNVEGKALFENLCVGCHRDNGMGTRTNTELGDGYTMIRFKAGIDPSDPNNIEYPDKDSLINKVALSMPQGAASDTCESECAANIADYLWEINDLGFEADYSCSNPNYVPKQVRLLTSFEYLNTLKDSLSIDVSEIIAYFPKEIGGDNFENDVSSANVDSARVQEYWNAALTIAQSAIAFQDLSPLYECDITTDSCVSEFIANMGKTLFRRPLLVEEQLKFEALFEPSLTQSDPMMGVQLTLQAMLSSPHFLYRSEIGESESETEISTLTAYETASLLSYTFTASSPDALLIEAADNDLLQTPEQLSAQVTRLLETDRAKEQMARFAAQWFGADEIMELPRNYVQFTDFTQEVRESMKQEFDLFVKDIIFNDLPVSTLLNAKYSYLNQTLANYYGVNAQIADENFVKTDFGLAKRQGVVTMGAVISSHAKGDENSPVFRGIFVRKDLLCQDLPSPPDISGQGGGFDPSLPVRERMAQHANIASCYNCHKVIDDLGFALENYNAIGQYLEQEYIASTGQVVEGNIDSSGILVGIESFLDDTSVPFANALELATVISQDDVSKQCAIEKWQQYSYGRTEDIACQKTTLFDLWQDKAFTMKQLLIESVKVPGYLNRQ